MSKNVLRAGAIAGIAAVFSIHATADSAAPPPAASAPLTGVVVDAAGTVMGPFYATQNSGQTAAVLVPLAGQPVLIPLKADAHATAAMLPVTNQVSVFFASDHCTGVAWLRRAAPVAGASPASISPIGGGDFAVYVPGNERAKSETYGSGLYVKDARARCSAIGGTEVLLRVDQVIDLGSVYTAPYHVQ